MPQAKAGDKVAVHYTGKLEDGTVFDSSREREPLEFLIGGQQVVRGFENGVIGMSVGEGKNVRISFEDAYGARAEDLVIKVRRNQIPSNIELEVGLHLQMKQADGTVSNVLVSELNEDSATLDANHPLAGKDLVFDIDLVAIQ